MLNEITPDFSTSCDDVFLRSAKVNDAVLMADIHADCFTSSWDCENIEDHIICGDFVDLLEVSSSDKIDIGGFALSRLVLDEAELLTLCLRTDMRGKSLSFHLLSYHLQRLRKAGARIIFLEVAVDNLAALALYRRLGFVIKGKRANYYSFVENESKDAFTMSLEL